MMQKLSHIAEGRGGKVLLAIWLLILVLIVGISAVSAFQGELFGGIAFSVLPAAILLNVSIVIASIIKPDSQYIAKTWWVFLCIAEIVFVFIVADPHHPDVHREVGMILGYTMFTLSFPLGFMGPLLLWAAGSLLSSLFAVFGKTALLDFGAMDFYISNFFAWLSFFIVGYLQWFKLLPYLIKKWKGRRPHSSPGKLQGR